MLQAFIDDSGSEPQSDIFVLAGLISTIERWEKLTREWTNECEVHPPTPDFRMAAANSLRHGYGGNGPRDERKKYCDIRISNLAKIISDNTDILVVIYLNWRNYAEIMKNKIPREIDRPYFYLFWNLIKLTSIWSINYGNNQKIDFIFDEQGKVGKNASSWYEHFIYAMSKDERLIIQSPPSFASDSNVTELKAADMVAWTARKYLTKGKIDNTILKEIFTNKPAIKYEITNDHLKELANYHTN